MRLLILAFALFFFALCVASSTSSSSSCADLPCGPDSTCVAHRIDPMLHECKCNNKCFTGQACSDFSQQGARILEANFVKPCHAHDGANKIRLRLRTDCGEIMLEPSLAEAGLFGVSTSSSCTEPTVPKIKNMTPTRWSVLDLKRELIYRCVEYAAVSSFYDCVEKAVVSILDERLLHVPTRVVYALWHGADTFWRHDWKQFWYDVISRTKATILSVYTFVKPLWYDVISRTKAASLTVYTFLASFVKARLALLYALVVGVQDVPLKKLTATFLWPVTVFACTALCCYLIVQRAGAWVKSMFRRLRTASFSSAEFEQLLSDASDGRCLETVTLRLNAYALHRVCYLRKISTWLTGNAVQQPTRVATLLTLNPSTATFDPEASSTTRNNALCLFQTLSAREDNTVALLASGLLWGLHALLSRCKGQLPTEQSHRVLVIIMNLVRARDRPGASHVLRFGFLSLLAPALAIELAQKTARLVEFQNTLDLSDRELSTCAHQSFPLPIQWTRDREKKNHASVLFDADDDEVAYVWKLFAATEQRQTHGFGRDSHQQRFKSFNILRVHRIENPALFQRFKACQVSFAKAHIDSFGRSKVLQRNVSTESACNRVVGGRDVLSGLACTSPEWRTATGECVVFHGTSSVEAAKTIAREGPRTELTGLRHKRLAFGNGLYYSDSVSKADQYTVADENTGERVLLVFLALMGDSVQDKWHSGCSKFTRPPCAATGSGCSRQGCGHKPRNGVIGTVNRFLEYIVYDPQQVYPAFLVVYKHI